MFEKIKALLVILLLASCASANADLAIIVHPDYQGGELNEELVRQLFLDEHDEFPSGHKAEPANHVLGSVDRKNFFEYVLKMSESKHKRYWARKKSIGKHGSPKELGNYEDVLSWVAKTPLGIAYIDKKMLNDSVKVLVTVAIFDDI